jgi:hypothetical protein
VVRDPTALCSALDPAECHAIKLKEMIEIEGKAVGR